MKPNHLLQEFILPVGYGDIDLYVRRLSGELKFDGGLAVDGTGHLSFNTYFNSFYEDYWIKHTALSSLYFVLAGSGRFWCSVYRETVGGGCSLIERVYVDLDAAFAGAATIPVPLVQSSHGHGGRIFVDLEVLTPSRLRDLSWRTSQEPLHHVALGVGICTFNRESFLLRTVEKLLDAPPTAALAGVVVVNQGARYRSAATHRVVEKAGTRLQIVEQANFGGAGGFARAAMACLDDPGITHVLFMDDDIDLTASHLITTAAFLRYAVKEIVLGGHMLDLYQKHMLYEAGNSISPANELRPNHHNLDLKQLPSLTALSRAAPSHFNGWWYAAIPVACFRDLGLPLPIFIRGDDLEFGTRLHNAGIDTVALPPVSVWHEPFYAKAPGWQLYYDMRNRLIFAAMYQEQFALDHPSKILKLLMVHLIRYDYQQAWFMMQAVVDYMKGPPLLEEGLPDLHARITSESKTLSPAKLGAALGISPAQAVTPPRPWAIRRRMLASLTRVLAGVPRRLGMGVLYTDVPLQWVRIGPSYILADRSGHFFQRYAYSRPVTWRLARQTVTAVARYAYGRHGVAARWRATHSELVSDAAWRTRLGIGPSTPASMLAEEARAA